MYIRVYPTHINWWRKIIFILKLVVDKKLKSAPRLEPVDGKHVSEEKEDDTVFADIFSKDIMQVYSTLKQCQRIDETIYKQFRYSQN